MSFRNSVSTKGGIEIILIVFIYCLFSRSARVITIPPVSTLTPVPPTFVPTFQPTPPLPTTCPPVPLVCLPNGQRPIPYCPCIDPRQPNGQAPPNNPAQPTQVPQPQPATVPTGGPVGVRPGPGLQSAVEILTNVPPTGRPLQPQLEFEGSPEVFEPARIRQPTAAEIMVFTSLAENTAQGRKRRRRKPQDCVDTRLRSGKCLTLAACPQLIEEFYSEAKFQMNGIDFQTYVSDFFCGFDGRNFLVCCAPGNRAQTQGPTISQPSNELSLGSLFQFAPLTALSGGFPVIFSNPTLPAPQQPALQQGVYPTVSPNAGTPPVIFQQQTLPNIPNMVLPSPGPILTIPTQPPMTLNPSPQSNGSSAGNCGISRGTTNRVVGGVEARRGSYPWMAALGYYDDTERNALKFLCGGSLISQKYIITSAHCITPTLAIVRLGAHDLSKPLEANAIDLQIKRKITHDNFDIRSIANDIALLELNTPAPITDFIGTICLPEGNNFLTQDFVGMHPFIAGWGAIKHQGPTSNVLRDAQVPIVSRQNCEQSYKTVFRFIEFSDKLICAGTSNVDACQGDSGGPLMLPTPTNGNIYRYFLIGLVSYGYECARNGFPGVYTRVASYMPWIKAHLT